MRFHICKRNFSISWFVGEKYTNSNAKSVSVVPMQDFSRPWTDEELYAKYGLTNDEIDFIESMIKPMEAGGDDDGN